MGFLDDVGTFFDVLINPEEYSDTGANGERFTYRKLKNFFDTHQIIRNVYLTKEDGKTTEVDLLAVSKRGVYVFESKNYSGLIYGDEKQQSWTQWLNKSTKTPFYNPIWQNNAHIKALQHMLKDYPDLAYFSIVIFSERCKLQKVSFTSPNTYVIKRDILESTVRSIANKSKEVITTKQRDEIISLLSKTSRPDEEVKEQHIQQIKDDLSKCPRCGGELVERKAKETGTVFYGCKNFPKCRYTTKTAPPATTTATA